MYRTYSLRFQIMFIVIAQVLAVILFFSTPDENNTGGLGVTMNSIWTWMIPICLGWVWVGSQTSHSGIRDALKSASQNVTGQSVYGIRDRTGDGGMVLDDGEAVELQPLIENTPATISKQWLCRRRHRAWPNLQLRPTLDPHDRCAPHLRCF